VLVYEKQGYYAKALKWHQKALNLKEKTLGKEHPSIAITYNNITGIYYNQGTYSKALECYQKALDISEKMLSKEHPNTARTHNNIALVLLRSG